MAAAGSSLEQAGMEEYDISPGRSQRHEAELSHRDDEKLVRTRSEANLESPLLSAITKIVLVTLRETLEEKKNRK